MTQTLKGDSAKNESKYLQEKNHRHGLCKEWEASGKTCPTCREILDEFYAERAKLKKRMEDEKEKRCGKE